jgi:hypothetical protein
MAGKTAKALPLPDSLIELLAAADKQRSFPPGTMLSLMQQESSGKAQYLNDPTTYHYPLNAEGKRIAGHTGKISTAFGPFGILESTAKDPGFGVKPLADKTSLAEQVRFAADYLDARSKSAGSLSGGLAGYGEGAKYATQVARRRDGVVAADPAASMVAQVPAALPVDAVQRTASPVVAEPAMAVAQAPVLAAGPVQPQPQTSPWQDYLAQLDAQPQGQPAAIQPADMAWGQAAGPDPTATVTAPDFTSLVNPMTQVASLLPKKRGASENTALLRKILG